MASISAHIVEVRKDGSIVVKAEKRGKDTYILKEYSTVVYDGKNKPRIGRDGKVIVRPYDKVHFGKKQYVVTEIGEKQVVLKRYK